MTASEVQTRQSFNIVLAALAEHFDAEGRDGGTLAAAALRDAVSKPYRRTMKSADPGPTLQAACRLPNAINIASYILDCRSMLDWTSWEGEGLAKDISSRLFTTELVGPDGHVHCESVRVGFLVSDVDTNYPVSSHSGEETYLVIAGVAEWTVGAEPYSAKLPGTLVHHPAWIPHGRRTTQQPFIGAWRWSGDLDLSSFSVS